MNRKLNITEMREETTNIENQVAIIESALTNLQNDVIAIFQTGWASTNSQMVDDKIREMNDHLTVVKDNTRRIRERIDAHVGNVETEDTVNIPE